MERIRASLNAGIALVFLLLTSACSGAPDGNADAPPRANDAIAFPKEPSQIAVDLDVELAALERALERELPRALWEIDQPNSECLAPRQVDLALFKVKSPKINCRITGNVVRGKLRLAGNGERLVVTLPVTGTLAARDVAGIFKGESATGQAEVTLALKLDLTPGWQLAATTRLDYRWTREPGIDFLGRRILLTSQADRELRPVKREVERIIARELAKLPVRELAAQGWRDAHQVFQLNQRDPAVWGQLTPLQFRFGGYAIKGRILTLRLGLDALLETDVGIRPEPVPPPRLPPLARRAKETIHSELNVPVVADYAVLEPVVARALAKRALRPFVIKDYGSVTAQFADIEVYGTGKGRIAVGGSFTAVSDMAAIGKVKGTIWLTALPVNQPNSRAVQFSDIVITGNADIVGEDFLLALANSPGFSETITTALAQNFDNDFNKLRAKIDRAIAKKEGKLADYSIKIVTVETGVIAAYGEGFYLPIDMTARITGKLRRLN